MQYELLGYTYVQKCKKPSEANIISNAIINRRGYITIMNRESCVEGKQGGGEIAFSYGVADTVVSVQKFRDIQKLCTSS